MLKLFERFWTRKTHQNEATDQLRKSELTKVDDLIEFGYQLSQKLEDASQKCHPKSDDHTVFLWESAIVKAKSPYLESGIKPTKHLKKISVFEQV